MRLLTETCCGDSGTLGNSIELTPGVPLPIDVTLPVGYALGPGSELAARNVDTIAPGHPLESEETIPAGTILNATMVLPFGLSLTNEADEPDSDFKGYVMVSIISIIWTSPTPTVSCPFPCVIILPPTPYPPITPTPVLLTTTISTVKISTTGTLSVEIKLEITVPP